MSQTATVLPLTPSSVLFLCLYFSLRPIDVEFMRHLSKVVNIVPVIAKADTLTLEERDYFKQKVSGQQRSPLTALSALPATASLKSISGGAYGHSTHGPVSHLSPSLLIPCLPSLHSSLH